MIDFRRSAHATDPGDDGFAKFSRKFSENNGANIFSKTRFRRCDRFRQKIIQIGAILAIFRPFQDFGRFGAKISRVGFFLVKVTFWRSCDFLIRVFSSVVKSYCPKYTYFWGDFLGEGVKDLDLAPKMTLTITRSDFGPKMTCTLWL